MYPINFITLYKRKPRAKGPLNRKQTGFSQYPLFTGSAKKIKPF